MNEKNRTYFICASIIISSIILGLFIYKGIIKISEFLKGEI